MDRSWRIGVHRFFTVDIAPEYDKNIAVGYPDATEPAPLTHYLMLASENFGARKIGAAISLMDAFSLSRQVAARYG